MHRNPLAAVLLTAAVAIVLPASAGALTLQRHLTIPHGATGRGMAHRVARWHVALDSDHDGIWNGPDECAHEAGPRSAGGCKPAPTPTVSVSETPITSTATTTYVPPPTTTTTGGCPSYMSGEASSPTDVNPDSGASGCWQVTPGTASAMGAACSDVNSTDCLAAICAAQGNEAWQASGATPCG